MKVTKKWLNEYVDCSDIDEKTLESTFTMSGTKVETIDKMLDVTNVVIAKIVKIDKHPEADKLVICDITDGKENYQIVTGAPNVSVGDIVPLAKIGSTLAGDIKIKRSKLRGVESEGMLCSYQELGLPKDFLPNTVEYGILILPEKFEKDLGKDFASVFSLDDLIIDFEITPNRQDCQGVKGIARELAAALKRDFKDSSNLNYSDFEKKDKVSGVSLDILDSDCKRYILAVVKNVEIKESPDWLKDRLRALDIKPINNIVDITNYVMLEIGQPMHAFDKEFVGDKIIVRSSEKGEKIELLDETENILDADLVIANDKKPLALAGIMGGVDSGVNDSTKTIILESANFKRKRLRDSAKRLKISTDSLARFEKNLPLTLAQYGMLRALELIKETNSGTIEFEVIDYIDSEVMNEQKPKKILLDLNKIERILGIKVSKPEVLDIFKRLEFNIFEEDEDIYVSSPDYRIDVKLIEDLAEEVIRLLGYDKLNSTLPSFEVSDRKENVKLRLKKTSKALLKDLGYLQIITYPFISKEDTLKLDLESSDVRYEGIEILNPLGPEYEVMRTSLIPSMLNVIKTNESRKNNDFSLFEIGKVYLEKANIDKGFLPLEEEHLILSRYNLKKTNKESVLNDMKYTTHPIFKLKEDLTHLMVRLGIKSYDLVNVDSKNIDSVYHKGIYAEIYIGKDRVGQIGMINPKVLNNFAIKGEVYVLDLVLSKLERYSASKITRKEISKYPSVERDISMLMPENIYYSDIAACVSKASRQLVKDVKLIDIYSNEEFEDKKSVTVRVVFNAIKRTLEEEEVNKEMEKIINNLKNNLNIEIR